MARMVHPTTGSQSAAVDLERLDFDTLLADLHRTGIPLVGPKASTKLAQAVGAFAGRPPEEATVEDLLYYTPMRYEDRSNLAKIRDLQPEMEASIEVEVRVAGSYTVGNGRYRIFELSGVDETGQIRAYWWNQTYLSNTFKQGTRVILFGQWKRGRRGHFEVENPDYEIFGDGDELLAAIHTGRRVPIYRKLGEFRTRPLRRIVFQILERLDLAAVPEILPPSVVDRLRLMSRGEALRNVHFPETDASLADYGGFRSPAHARLVFEEFFWLSLALAYRRVDTDSQPKGPLFEVDDRVREAVRSILPFKPTGAQKRVFKEIVDDMTSHRPMNRLLQGDVGSGKTIVALQSMVVAVENGYQTALMVPTEILAEQHARNIKRILASTPYRVELFTGSVKAARKRELRESLAAGEIDIAIGTHALIQETVEFSKLGLVVIDEQHRFGVMQRAELIRRGYSPDVLVMTATPIPRSLAMTVYGDLHVSVIDELPPGRTPVTTAVRGDDSRNRVYHFLDKEIREGRQVYIVYPLVEESEKLDLLAATAMADHLQTEVFPSYTIGLVHGRLKPEEKDEAMRRFLANEIQILVATTVIEVGVDVSNASIMIVEHAERFGLSQLHQLRGRVGRGAAKSYCILMTGKKKTAEARERLAVMEKSTDGFVIAEKDLELRGPGELFGTRQHGIPAFRIGNIVRDRPLLEMARTEADELIDPRRNTREAAEAIERVRAMPKFGLSRVG
jgi:ATP-dependent DNA helicase RecG